MGNSSFVLVSYSDFYDFSSLILSAGRVLVIDLSLYLGDGCSFSSSLFGSVYSSLLLESDSSLPLISSSFCA